MSSVKIKMVCALVILGLPAMLLQIVFGDKGFLDLKEMIAEKNRIVLKNEDIRRHNCELYRTVNRLKNDLEFIENVAKQELGMIRSDEILFKFKKEVKNKE